MASVGGGGGHQKKKTVVDEKLKPPPLPQGGEASASVVSKSARQDGKGGKGWKAILVQYGKVAVVFHSTVYCVSLAAVFAGVRAGVDIEGMASLAWSCLPGGGGGEGVGVESTGVGSSPADPDSFKGKLLGLVSDVASPETAAQLGVAWVVTALTGPVRYAIDIMAVPVIGRMIYPVPTDPSSSQSTNGDREA